MQKKKNIEDIIAEEEGKFPIAMLNMAISDMKTMEKLVPHVKIVEVEPLQTLTLTITACQKPISKIIALKTDVE